MIDKIKRKIYNKFFKEYHQKLGAQVNFPDFQFDEIKIIKEVSKFTLTSPERIVNLIRAVKHIEKNKIEGDIVECGVWKGGSIMAILKVLKDLNSFDRDIYLYDTFEGMSEPTEIDESYKGESATSAYFNRNEFCLSPLSEVQNNVTSINYPTAKIHFIKGKVEETIPDIKIPEKIAVLRLDTDWYQSTLHELEHLFPRLVKGGILIIDDYGHWQGCKKAVDEYIDKNNLELLLIRIDYTCRISIKI